MYFNDSHEINITNNIVYDGDPSWSPDGKKIVFTRQADPNKPGDSCEIYIINNDGSNVIRLTNNNVNDSTKLVLVRNNNILLFMTQLSQFKLDRGY